MNDKVNMHDVGIMFEHNNEFSVAAFLFKRSKPFFLHWIHLFNHGLLFFCLPVSLHDCNVHVLKDDYLTLNLINNPPNHHGNEYSLMNAHNMQKRIRQPCQLSVETP